MKTHVLILFLSVFSFELKSQSLQRTLYNEKVYLSTDKDVYNTRDSIRVKGFVVDSWEHKTDSVSRFLYVELVDISDNILERRKLRRNSQNGFATLIKLDSTIAVGHYFLRGYTQPMKYLEPEYIFTKYIVVDDAMRMKNESSFDGELLSSEPDYSVDFFVEGGNLVDNAAQRVVFVGKDKFGLPHFSRGLILSDRGDTVSVARSSYNGIGEFLLVSQKDRTYRYVTVDGKEFDINLPKGAPSVRLTFVNSEIRYMVDGVQSGDYTLMIHSHGALIHHRSIKINENFGAISVDKLAAGVMCFTLIDKTTDKIVSERVCYIDNRDGNVDNNLKTEKPIYATGEQIPIQVNSPKSGDFLISLIKKENLNHPALKSGFTTSLWLQSELSKWHLNLDNLVSGSSENIAQKRLYLDMIMITENWGRYVRDIKNYDSGFGKEDFESISGRVIGSKIESISILAETLDSIYVIDLNSNKTFFAPLPDFAGTSEFFIQPLAKNSKPIPAQLEIRQDYFPSVQNTLKKFSSLSLNLKTETIVKADTSQEYVLSPINRQIKDSNGMMSMTVEELEVIGKRRVKREVHPTAENRSFYSINKIEGDDVIRFSDGFDVAAAVDRLINVNAMLFFFVETGTYEYVVTSGRGQSVMKASVDDKGRGLPSGCIMKVMIDGTFAPADLALRYHPSEIESIEKMSVSEASVYGGSRGLCGIINIKTKSASKPDPSKINSQGVSLDKLGYHPSTNNVFCESFKTVKNLSDIFVIAPDQTGEYYIRVEGVADDGTLYDVIKEVRID